MAHAVWMPDITYLIFHTYCFSKATTVTRKRLNVTFIRTIIICLAESYVLKFNTQRLGKWIGPRLKGLLLQKQNGVT
jgi:hypothetical protein